jgi:uncharacterized membrane protein
MSKKRRRSGRQGSTDGTPEAAHRRDTRADEPRDEAKRARAPHPLDNWLIALVAAGIALTAYLTFIAWFGEHPAFCGAGSECDIVQQSRWSTFLGAPMAFWGLLTYALLARQLWRLRTRPSAWRTALLLAAVGAAVSWYLTAVSVFAIEATCGYCLASFGVMNALLVLLLLRRPAHMPEHAWAKSLPTPAGVSALIVLVMFLHFSGVFNPAAGPEQPYLKALALHLRDSGARFYGAYWCPHCQEQKEMFEASADRLPYIECTPNGRSGARSMACTANDIRDYPTWILDGRRYTGVLPVAELARLSGFKGPPGTPGN